MAVDELGTENGPRNLEKMEVARRIQLVSIKEGSNAYDKKNLD